MENSKVSTHHFRAVLLPETHADAPYIALVHYENGTLKEEHIPFANIFMNKIQGDLAYRVYAEVSPQLTEGAVLVVSGDWEKGDPTT